MQELGDKVPRIGMGFVAVLVFRQIFSDSHQFPANLVPLFPNRLRRARSRLERPRLLRGLLSSRWQGKQATGQDQGANRECSFHLSSIFVKWAFGYALLDGLRGPYFQAGGGQSCRQPRSRGDHTTVNANCPSCEEEGGFEDKLRAPN